LNGNKTDTHVQPYLFGQKHQIFPEVKDVCKTISGAL